MPLLQVPLGVLPKNETKYEDMMDILQHLQGYVLAIDVRREMKVPGSDVPLAVDDKEFTTTLMGGDQLTVARGHFVILATENDSSPSFSSLCGQQFAKWFKSLAYRCLLGNSMYNVVLQWRNIYHYWLLHVQRLNNRCLGFFVAVAVSAIT